MMDPVVTSTLPSRGDCPCLPIASLPRGRRCCLCDRCRARKRHLHGRHPYGHSYERSPLQAVSSTRRQPAYGRRAHKRRPYGRLPLQYDHEVLPTFSNPYRKLAMSNYPLRATSVAG
ncbi:hypothetical protein B296_00041160 [Ensete ventricosum]|uniref:Uncharacterized protein n=1 Tax=Ensete ventricosum TaxID=4639 RepID=A0A426XY65_ENSVE|nr:hypothetical protein B296_00041160 [Ensete ventricosum]